MATVNILLIDDETDYSDTMSFYLKAKGYRVKTASSGEEGLKEIERERPDIVFLDFKMPGMDGVETLRRIREIDRDLPVIMVTSYASDESVLEAKRLGISDIFPKAEDLSLAAKLINRTLNSPDLKCNDRED